jgi:hypothetical protein
MSEADLKLLPLAKTEEIGLGVCRRTLGRRIKDPNSGFPTPIRLNGRLYVRKSDLDTYKLRLIREGGA